MTLIAVVVFAAGCGESTSPGRATVSTKTSVVGASKDELIARADSICGRMNAEFAQDQPKDQSIAETARITPHRATLEQRVVSELSKLRPPHAFAGELERVISARRTLARELTQVARDAKAGDAKAVGRLAASKARLHHDLRTFAAAAGFKVCGRVG